PSDRDTTRIQTCVFLLSLPPEGPDWSLSPVPLPRNRSDPLGPASADSGLPLEDAPPDPVSLSPQPESPSCCISSVESSSALIILSGGGVVTTTGTPKS